MRSDITAGGVFPDYALPDHTSTVRRLSEIQGRDPMIVTLARGNYCPKEHRQHLELAEHYPEIVVAYTQIATIATDDHHTLQELRNSVCARPSFYDLWRDLRVATAEIRPDWDLSTPGLREAWDAGDYSKFHGWDRRAPTSAPTSDTWHSRATGGGR